MAFQLQPSVNHYAWGVPGSQPCKVAELYAAGGGRVDPAKPYSELWIGDHTSGMNHVLPQGTPLNEWLSANPQAKGTLANQLPFLLKVQSVNKALSIQAHPDQALAAELHAKDPSLYRDPNHKPEMALALTHFEALCGFRDPVEVHRFCQQVPAFGEALGSDLVTPLADAKGTEAKTWALRAAYARLFELSQEDIARVIAAAELRDGEVFNLVRRVHGEHGTDVGVLPSSSSTM